jgi:indolepyruvate ferredoxin oxidoreductase, beta subunit
MNRPITIAVLAIGGQGGGVLVDWIVALTERQGWRAQSTSVPGVAQRTGATVYYVEAIEAAGGQTPVFSAVAAPGDVDIVIAAEWMEAGRAMQRGLVTPDRTTLIASTHRTFAVSEKEIPGDGIAEPGAVTAAARAASQRFVAFDMAALAERAGSVVSSVLFGALCGAAVLPFPRAAFEATITEAGVGVAGSLRGFALGFDAVAAPPETAPSRPEPPLALTPVGHPPYDALLARATKLPVAAHEMLAEGLRHVVAYQDIAYGAAYLDAVESVAQFDRVRTSTPSSWSGCDASWPDADVSGPGSGVSWPSSDMSGPDSDVSWPGLARPPTTLVNTARAGTSDHDTPGLTGTAAKYIARAMAYDDVIRVAALKTQPARSARVQREMGGQVIAVTEFMHPRMEELLGLLPPALGIAIERRPRLVALLDRVFCGPRRIRTDTIFGFLMLYVLAGLRGGRRKTLRHAHESARIDTWLTTVRSVAPQDPALAAELLANQRLIKGYSETHARGLDKFTRVMGAAERLRGRPDAADWVRRLREAALKDEQGLALDAALRTVDTFLDERTAA